IADRSTISRKNKNSPGDEVNHPDTWKNVLIVAWTGTRGIISLATALALPLTLADGTDFPKRHSIIFLSFVVIFVTLVVQGLSLPLLIRILRVKPHNDEGEEERELKLYLASSTLHFIDHELTGYLEKKLKDELKKDYEIEVSKLTKEIRDNKKRKRNNNPLPDAPVTPLLTAQAEVNKFQHELLITLHKEGTFSDAVLKKNGFERDIDNLKLDINKPTE
ncbi:MAG TPA: cation:proton antiporter, partial [Chitinophagaceae bacterium]|nr:cation:proton antiporter [Chitinophagaceae bacterium]